MKALLSLTTALGLAASALPADALPTSWAAPTAATSSSDLVPISTWQKRAGRHHHHAAAPYAAEPATSSDPGYGESGAVQAPANGGYVVNRYGFGNYVGGPGGFAGYPAGSAGAQIYRQQEEWKCEAVPETC